MRENYMPMFLNNIDFKIIIDLSIAIDGQFPNRHIIIVIYTSIITDGWISNYTADEYVFR